MTDISHRSAQAAPEDARGLLLEHYTAGPFVIEHRTYQQPEPHLYGKPKGLWISVKGEDDWPSWCQSEDFGADRLSHRTAIEIVDGTGLLFVSDGSGLQDLEDRFSVVIPRSYGSDLCIDWRAVAAEYDGVIIAPYQWEDRLARDWYYVWDCASGCIWNVSAISKANGL